MHQTNYILNVGRIFHPRTRSGGTRSSARRAKERVLADVCLGPLFVQSIHSPSHGGGRGKEENKKGKKEKPRAGVTAGTTFSGA